MKIKKLTLTSLSALGIMFGSTASLSSCAKKEDTSSLATITFTHSDGVTLFGDKQIKVAKGTTWDDLLIKQQIPTAQTPENYTSLGWCRPINDDLWKLLTGSEVFNSDETVKYVAYDNSKHSAATVTLDFSPGQETEPITLDFVTGFTLYEFRVYYSIPAIPTTEGYTFGGFYTVSSTNKETRIDDSYVIKANDTIKIKWVAEKRTAKLTTDGNGAIDKSSVDFDYDAPFSTIDDQVKFFPNDGYKFDKWVDENGVEIKRETKMTNDFLAKAIFVPTVKYAIQFSCSEGVTLSSETPITVVEGTIWDDIQSLPTATVPQGYADEGWVAIYDDGTFQKINSGFQVSRGLHARYIAYDPAEYTLDVKFYCDPDPQIPPVQLKARIGSTFKEFREYHKIPEAPSYEGYTFKGFYCGDTLIDDNWTFPTTVQTGTEIKAKYEQIICTVSLITDGHGALSKQEIQVPYGRQWSDVISDVIITPESGYLFAHWINNDTGEQIKSDFKITNSFTAVACFTIKAKFTILGHRARDYGDGGHHFANVEWINTRVGYNGDHNRWNEPQFIDDNILHYQSSKKCNDCRLLTTTIQIDIPLLPNTTKKSTLTINGKMHCEVNGHALTTDIRSTAQVFKLDSAADHPAFYTNNAQEDVDEKCHHIYRQHRRRKDFHNWRFDEDIESTEIEYTDQNDTSEIKTFTHYIAISFLITGELDATDGDTSFTVDHYLRIM